MVTYDVEVVHCNPQTVVVDVRTNAQSLLRVEIGAHQNPFTEVAGLGVSPVGSWADWKLVSEEVRAGFDAVQRCIAEVPIHRIRRSGNFASGAITQRGKTGPGMLLILGGVLSLLTFILVGTQNPRTVALNGIGLGALASGTVVLRHLLAPASWLHQYGQGPLWIRFALCGASPYGAGQQELFGWAIRFSDPDGAVFIAQSILAALATVAMVVMVRVISGRATWAWLCGIGFASVPIIARLMQSESYFASQTSLIMIAAATLAVAGYRGKLKQLRFHTGVLGASLLLAQAARVHPNAWPVVAMMPLLCLVRVGAIRTRIHQYLYVQTILMVVIGLTSGRHLMSVYHGTHSQHMRVGWSVIELAGYRWTWIAAFSVVGALLVPFSINMRSALLRWVVWVLTAVAFTVFVPVSREFPAVWSGFASLHLAIATATMVAMIATTKRRRVFNRSFVVVCVVGIVLLCLGTWGTAQEIDSQQREAQWLRSIRNQLPDDALVFTYRGQGQDLVHLPLYGDCAIGPSQVRIEDFASSNSEQSYLYRGSTCSESNKAICSRFTTDDVWRVFAQTTFEDEHGNIVNLEILKSAASEEAME